MKLVVILSLFLALPFINTGFLSFGNNSVCSVKAQEQEKKEEPKEKKEGEKEYYEKVPEDDKVIYKVDDGSDVPERLKYYKEKYELTYNAPFELVWNSIQQSLDDINCSYMKPNYKITEEGYYKGTIKTDFCLFTEGEDSTFDVLEKYSYKLPLIRGGKWINGRLQYKFLIKQTGDNEVYVLLKTEMSGYEAAVTNEVQFWKSNGILEKRLIDIINSKVNGTGG